MRKPWKRPPGWSSWSPGSWTPARCALWRSFEGKALRDRLAGWVDAEKKAGFCHKAELPKIEGVGQ